jgi:hypothetical protein
MLQRRQKVLAKAPSTRDLKRTSAYLFCRDAVHGCRTKGRQQQFGPKEQILARFTAQTNLAVTPPIRPRGP